MSEYLESGMRQREFCAEAQVSVGTLQYWLRKIGAGAGEEGTQEWSGTELQSANPLLEVRLAGGSSLSGVPSAAGYEVVVENGRRLRIPSGFDAREVAALVSIMEERL